MAVTGKFLADFEDFFAATQKAEGQLRSFESTAQQAAGAVDTMATGTVPAAMQQVTTQTEKATLSFRDLATAVGAIAGVVAGVSAAVATLGQRGAAVADVSDAFGTLTTSIGQSSQAMLTTLQQATLGTVSNFELMQTVNKGLSQGLNLTTEQMGTVGDAAAVLADRVGGDTGQAFETLITALSTGNDRMLKTIGLNIDAAAETKAYADSVGKTTGQLTEEEKKQALVNAILAESQRVLAQSGKATADFGDVMDQSKVKVTNFVDSIATWVAQTPAIGTFASAITAVSSTVSALGLAWGPVSTGISSLMKVMGATGGFAGIMASAGTAIAGVTTALTALAPFLLPAGIIIAGAAAVYLAFKNWDKITEFARAVYTGIKTWLVDKFQGIVDGVKNIVGSITGFFQSMADKVVFRSIVPEMIDAIGSEFARLQQVMVAPTEQATNAVNAALHTVTSSAQGAQDALKFPVPQGFSFEEAYRQAGFVTHGSLAGGNVHAGGQRGAMVNYFTIQDSFFDTPSSTQRMADKFGDAMLTQLRSQGRTVG